MCNDFIIVNFYHMFEEYWLVIMGMGVQYHTWKAQR